MFVGQPRRAGTSDDQQAIFGFGNAGDRQRNAGIDDVGDQIDPAGIVPLARDAGRDIRLVLMVGRHQFDLEARLFFFKEIIDRHLRSGDGAGAGQIGKHARHVREHSDLHGAVGDARRLCEGAQACRGERSGNDRRA